MFKKIIILYLLTIFLVILLGLTGCASSTNSESSGQYLDSSIITTKVKVKLATELGANSLRNINVTTYKGVVQLSGFVANEKQIKLAVKVTRSIAGVKTVENALIIRKKIH